MRLASSWCVLVCELYAASSTRLIAKQWEVYHGKRAWAGMHPMQVLFRVAVQKHPLDFPNDVHQDYVVRG